MPIGTAGRLDPRIHQPAWLTSAAGLDFVYRRCLALATQIHFWKAGGMFGRSRGAVISLFVLSAAARADQYSVAYEGNDFPENEGWERIYGDENGPQQGGSNRSIEDGWLVLDSTRHHLIYDTYFWHQQINPDPGELFVCEWRINVIENIGLLPDSRLAIARDGGGSLGFQIGVEYVRSSREGWSLPLTPGTPHTFRVQSADMLAYLFFIDGHPVQTGEWDLDSLNESYVAFGDSAMGGGITSRAAWDYVRFGVIPEPDSGTLMALTGGLFLSQTRLRPIDRRDTARL